MKLIAVKGKAVGRQYHLQNEVSIVGRPRKKKGRRPHVSLSGDPGVSHEHAKISRRKGVWLIEDCSTVGGTFLNGEEIGELTEIWEGDEIRVGETVLEFVSDRYTTLKFENLLLGFDPSPTVNYSLAHCGRPIVLNVAVANKGRRESSPVGLSFTVEGYAISEPLQVPTLSPGERQTLSAPKFIFDMLNLESKSESVQANLAVHFGDAVLKRPISVLAYNEWSDDQSHRATLASFVLPRHPIAQNILLWSRPHVLNLTGADSFPTVARCRKADSTSLIAQAIYDCLLRDHHIHYFHQPASGEGGTSQRIRLPHQLIVDPVGQQGEGACLDLSLLIASCLELAGVNPLLILTGRGDTPDHCLVGVWLSDAERFEPLIVEKDRLTAHVDSGAMLVFEAAGVAEGNDGPYDFGESQKRAEEKVAEFLYAVDVRAAKEKGGVRTLPFEGRPCFSEGASAALRKARRLAAEGRCSFVGTIHLLLALIRLGCRELDDSLRNLNIQCNVVAEKIQKSVPSDAPFGTEPVFSDHFRQVMAVACERAKKGNFLFIEERHLLRALFEVPSRTLDKILEHAGASRTQFLEEVSRQEGKKPASVISWLQDGEPVEPRGPLGKS